VPRILEAEPKQFSTWKVRSLLQRGRCAEYAVHRWAAVGLQNDKYGIFLIGRQLFIANILSASTLPAGLVGFYVAYQRQELDQGQQRHFLPVAPVFRG